MPVLVPRSLSGGMYASGAADHNTEVKSYSHEHSRLGGEAVDEILLVQVCVKVDILVIKPTQPGLQHLQPVTLCCTGRPKLDPVPRHGLTGAELCGTAQPACPSTPKDPPPPATFAARSPGDVGVTCTHRDPEHFSTDLLLARQSLSRIKAPIKMKFKTQSVGRIHSDPRPSVATAHYILKHCFYLC